jgi:putative heme-binding domain-containing protein
MSSFVGLNRTFRLVTIFATWIVLTQGVRGDESAVNRMLELAGDSTNPEIAMDIISGISASVRPDRRSVPKAWAKCFDRFVRNDCACRIAAIQLGIQFGDPQSVSSCVAVVRDSMSSLADRIALIRAGSNARLKGFEQELVALLDEDDLQVAAIVGLASFQSPRVADELIKRLPGLNLQSRTAAIETLVTREASARELCIAITANPNWREWISSPTIRQLRTFNTPELKKLVERLWGKYRKSKGEHRITIERLRNKLVAQVIAEADLTNGEKLCATNCLTCHELHGKGKHLGPNLTGAQRYDMYYLLSNIVDPSADVDRDFQLSVIETIDGRTLSGIVTRDTDKMITIQTQTNTLSLTTDQIEDRSLSRKSMMPDGLLDAMSDNDIRDLIAYLMSDYRK